MFPKYYSQNFIRTFFELFSWKGIIGTGFFCEIGYYIQRTYRLALYVNWINDVNFTASPKVLYNYVLHKKKIEKNICK